MEKERLQRIGKRVLEVLGGLVALGLAFVAGFLVQTKMPTVSFAKMPERVKIDVSFAGGVALVKGSDARAFAVVGDGAVVRKEEKDANLLRVTGLSKDLRLFSDAFEVVLHLDGLEGVGVASVAKDPTPASSSSSGTSAKTKTTGFVASSRGTKYYFPDCSEVKSIKKENLVSFNTEAEAKAAGLSASKCVEGRK